MDDYHLYLCDLMRLDLPEHRHYHLLMEHLDEKPFKSVHPMDRNREIDGLDLRREYEEMTGTDISGPITCLEVLVALSRRIEIEIMGEPGDDHIEKWFWLMLRNLGLDVFEDDSYDHRSVDKILDIWLNRRFEKNGKGGIFPVKSGSFDSTKTDIWYQMQNYLLENYPI